MKNLPITFLPSEGEVYIHRIYDCEFCYDTGRTEAYDYETSTGSGYYKKCFNCREDEYDPDAK